MTKATDPNQIEITTSFEKMNKLFFEICDINGDAPYEYGPKSNPSIEIIGAKYPKKQLKRVLSGIVPDNCFSNPNITFKVVICK